MDIVFYHVPGGFASLSIILDEVEYHVSGAIYFSIIYFLF